MSEAAKLREMMKNKAKRLASGDPSKKVDASSWTPSEPLNADVKTGMRPVSRRAYKKGGKVMGECGPMRADRKPRKSGGKASKVDDTPIVDRLINRDLKKANEFRQGKKHIGGMKKGGKAESAAAETANKVTSESYRRELEKSQSTSGGEPQASDLYDKQQLERLERGYKKGGRTKKNLGGMLKMLSPIAMLASLGDDDKDEKKRGGRAKKQAGGLLNDPRTAGDAILQNSAAASGVSPDRMSFAPGMPAQGMKKFLGLKKGGKVSKESWEHSKADLAQDKRLAKKYGMSMESWEKSKMDAKHDKQQSSKGLKKGGRTGKADGGAPMQMGTGSLSGSTTSTAPATTPVIPAATATTPVLRSSTSRTSPVRSLNKPSSLATSNADRMKGSGSDSKGRDSAVSRRAEMQKARMERRSARQAERNSRRNPTPAAASTVSEAATIPAADTGPKMKRSPRYGSAAMIAAKKGGRIGKFGGGALEYARGGMPPRGMRGRGRGDDRPNLGRPAGGPNIQRQPGPVTGGPMPLPNQQNAMQQIPPQVMQQYLAANQQAQPQQIPPQFLSNMQMGTGAMSGAPQASGKGPGASPAGAPPAGAMFNTGGRVARKSGGKTKSAKTNINIVIAGKPQSDMEAPMPPMPPPAGPPSPPMGPPGMPPPPPMGGPGPMGRKAGGKVYRSYKDMDAGAGSGVGRLEKTEIQSRKRGS